MVSDKSAAITNEALAQKLKKDKPQFRKLSKVFDDMIR